jgi:MoaA/NifB/PqqE/SkfB family radical SAM enzyme
MEAVLTTACNLSCAYCYQNRRSDYRMQWATLRASADLLIESAEPEVSLTFFGGEPLLEYPLIRRCVDYVKDRAPADEKTIRFTVITNPPPRACAAKSPSRTWIAWSTLFIASPRSSFALGCASASP